MNKIYVLFFLLFKFLWSSQAFGSEINFTYAVDREPQLTLDLSLTEDLQDLTPPTQPSLSSLDSFSISLESFDETYTDKWQEHVQCISEAISGFKDVLKQNVHNIPENKDKNRPHRIFPYDHNFMSSPSVPYLSGSQIYVPEVSPYSYIATQAPLPSTIKDHFMIMKEHNSRTLISLVMPKEPKKTSSGIIILDRCADYWSSEINFENGFTLKPVGSSKIFKLSGTEQSVIVRTLQMEHYDGEIYEIQHIHFQDWPDHGTPNPTVFSKFNELVREKLNADRNNGHGSPVVHCHAGHGRTGIAIAIQMIQDYLDTEMKEHNGDFSKITINVPKLVFGMKLCRDVLTADPEQYAFVLNWTREYLNSLASRQDSTCVSTQTLNL